MATFVHIAPESDLAAIRRNGLKPARLHRGGTVSKGLFAVPVGPDFLVSHQWLRELRRWRTGSLYGVYFRIPDDEKVLIGPYSGPHEIMTATEACAIFQNDAALGYEVIIGRRVTPREIRRIKALPQVVGWRYYPAARGNRPFWPTPGTIGARKLRDQFAVEDARIEAQRRAKYGDVET